MGTLSDSQSLSDCIRRFAYGEPIAESIDSITSRASAGSQGDNSVPAENTFIPQSEVRTTSNANSGRIPGCDTTGIHMNDSNMASSSMASSSMASSSMASSSMTSSSMTDSAAYNIEEFRLYLSARNMSKNTIHVYTFAIRQFFSLYREMTYSNLKLYKVFLLEHYKPQTVNLRIRALNSYIEFREMEPGRLPMVRIQQKNYLDNVISEADYEYLKNCLIRDQKYLYYFIIRFMAATGSRVSEVVQFKAEDIFAGYKDIYSKGNKVRRIYVPKALQKSTLSWLKSIQRDRGYIFLNRYGNPITPGGIRGQLKQLAAAYGMNPEVVHPHSFRHRFAKSFIEKCGDLSMLSDLLGHKNLETTRIYLRRSSTEQYEIVNKVVNW